MDAQGGEQICALEYNNPENARLIAAAPELLEALKDAIAALQIVFPKPAPNGQINRGLAAIAKATGAA